MAMEKAFGVLKGQWKILLKKLDMPLQNVLDVITTSICFHNLCINIDVDNLTWNGHKKLNK